MMNLYQHGRRRVLPVGTIVYLQDGVRPFSFPRFPVRREPYTIEAYHNREYFPSMEGAQEVTYMTGGHLATLRSLRDSRRVFKIADWILRMHDDAGLAS